SWASAHTADSTQPPDTDPTAESSGPTSMAAPGCRGAERQVPTTVPMPTVSPDPHQASRSLRTSRIGAPLKHWRVPPEVLRMLPANVPRPSDQDEADRPE